MKIYAINTTSSKTYVIANDLNEAVAKFEPTVAKYAERYRIITSVDIIATEINYEAKEGICMLII